MTSADVGRALEILDAMPQSDVDRLRASIAATDAALQSGAPASQPATARTHVVEEDAVFAAAVFVLWSTSDASLARSL